ncbi:MAG: hypothetical protein IGQ45_04285 [Cyanobacterium sp. T60_A2020_053]|nr:hypothetical protein [Cyanobacterium sp. T60_A2020_053]
MTDKKTKQGQMETTLKDWGATIDSLKAEADKVGDDAKADLQSKIEYLEGKKAEMQARLDEFKASGEDAWETMASGFQSAWDEVGKAFEEASAKFNK